MQNYIINTIFVSLILTSLFSNVLKAEIYYSEKVAGPIVNIYSVNSQGIINKITNSGTSRDLDHDVSIKGLVTFSSNRINQQEKTNEMVRHRNAIDYNIYIMNPESKKLSQITNERTQEQQPKFSPSGNELAFIRSNKTQQKLIVYDLHSKKEKVVTTAQTIHDFSWNSSGTQIAFTNITNNSSNIAIVDINTLLNTVIVSTAVNQVDKKLKKMFVAVNWSPNDEYIAYIEHPMERQVTRKLNVYNLLNNSIQLVSSKDVQVQSPITWSNNSNNLLYSALVNYQQYYDENKHKKVYLGAMHIFNSNLLGETQMLTKGDHLFKHPVYSPDTSRIAYLYADKLNARTLQLKTMKLDGTDLKTLSKSVFKNAKIHWQ